MSKTAQEILNELEHYGVKGMKWGVRKDRSSGSSEKKTAKVEAKSAKAKAKADKTVAKADNKWQKKSVGTKKYYQTYNAAADRMNKTEIARINKKYAGKDTATPGKVQDQYYKEYSDTFQKMLNEEGTKIYGESPSGLMRVEFKYDGSQAFPDASFVSTSDGSRVTRDEEGKRKVKHEDDEEIEFEIKLTASKDGKISAIKVVKSGTVEHLLDETGGDSLEHYGVKGMKWGVRKDRSSKTPRSEKKAAKTEAKSAKKKAAAAKKAANDPKNLSNDELRKQNERMRLEQEFKRLKKEGRPSSGPVVDFLAAQGGRQIKRVANKAIDYGVETLLESAGIDLNRKKKKKK